MVHATFEHEGNRGVLRMITHFGKSVEIPCIKCTDESFRMGGTAINDVMVYEGLVTRLPELGVVRPYTTGLVADFKAFRSPQVTFEGMGILSDEEWTRSDLHCYVTEYYSLDMEGQSPGWFISKSPIKDAQYLFVNLDVLDGGGNVVKRYRVSPFTGAYKELVWPGI